VAADERRGAAGPLRRPQGAGVEQRRQEVLHPEVGARDLEVEQGGDLAGARVDEGVQRRLVTVDDLNRLPGAHAGGAQVVAQVVEARSAQEGRQRVVFPPVPGRVRERHPPQRLATARPNRCRPGAP
jgi:hypothetical protein